VQTVQLTLNWQHPPRLCSKATGCPHATTLEKQFPVRSSYLVITLILNYKDELWGYCTTLGRKQQSPEARYYMILPGCEPDFKKQNYLFSPALPLKEVVYYSDH